MNRVRILDGRISASDHVDVISILAAAAKDREVKECLSRPEPVVIAPEPIYNSIDEVRQQPSPQKPAYQQNAYQQSGYQQNSYQQPQQSQQPQPQPAAPQRPEYQNPRPAEPEKPEPAPAPEKKRGFSLWGTVRERLVNLMTEPVEDDDIDNDN